MKMEKRYRNTLETLKSTISGSKKSAFLWTGTAESQVIADMLIDKVEEDVEWFTLKDDGLDDFKERYLRKNNVEVTRIEADSSDKVKEETVRDIIEKGHHPIITGTSSSAGMNPLEGWNEKHTWAYLKREFVDRPGLYEDGRVNRSEWDYWDMRQKVRKTKEILEDSVEENSILLWTGGKEAQVLADILVNKIGDKGEASIPFGVIDTGNQFKEMYNFRASYLEDKDIDLISEKFDEFLEKIINNPQDPRGYHGEHRGTWKCSNCGSSAELNEKDHKIECSVCGSEDKLESIQRQNLKSEDWGVPESCGALKVEPLKSFVEDHGYEKLISGRRGEDTLVETDSSGEVEVEEEVENPVPHTRINPLSGWDASDVWAYIRSNNVPYCKLYNQGYNHTDSKCCTTKSGSVGEYGEGGRDAEKEAAKDALQDMGYI